MDRLRQQNFSRSAIQLEVDQEITTRFEKSCLIGKILLDRKIQTEVVKSVTLWKWKCKKDYLATEIKRNMFVFSFQDEQDWKHVILNSPWTVHRGLLILSPWTCGKIPEELQFSFSPFWVQVHGLPIDFLRRENGLKIGKLIGDFVYADGILLDENTLWNKFLRIRVVIDTRKPLVPGFWLKRRTPLLDIWVEFKYERLELFCYKCGRIGTSYNVCRFPAGEVKFGPWLRADSDQQVFDKRRERDGKTFTALVTMSSQEILSPQVNYSHEEDIPVSLRMILPRLILNTTNSLIMATNGWMFYSRAASAYAYDTNWNFLILMLTYIFYVVIKWIRVTKRSRIFKSSSVDLVNSHYLMEDLIDIFLMLLFLVMIKSY